jgi:hypothetical protein
MPLMPTNREEAIVLWFRGIADKHSLPLSELARMCGLHPIDILRVGMRRGDEAADAERLPSLATLNAVSAWSGEPIPEAILASYDTPM